MCVHLTSEICTIYYAKGFVGTSNNVTSNSLESQVYIYIYMKGTLYFKFISPRTYIKKWWWLVNKLGTTWLNENGQQMQQFANVCVVINALLKKNSFVMFVVRSSPHTNKFLKGHVVPLWFLNHHDINHNSYFSSCIVVCNLMSLWHLILIVIFSLLSKNKRD